MNSVFSINLIPPEKQNVLERVLKKYPKGAEKAGAREILYYLLTPDMDINCVNEIIKSISYFCKVSPRFLLEIIRNDLGYEKQESKVMYKVQVCTSVSCLLRGGGEVLKSCEKWLGLPCGSQTVDRQFSLSTKNCFNQCATGPIVKINHHQKEEITPTKIVFWLQSLLGEEKRVSSSAPTLVCNPYTSPSDIE
jgi:NADH:ubiquinone oxidoreductase subunit E